jgi:hypothetical protein
MKRLITDNGEELTVGILAGTEDSQRVLALEPVGPDDVALAREQALLDGLRAGVLPSDFTAVTTHLLAGDTGGKDRLKNFRLELSHGSAVYRRQFPIAALARVARRAEANLRAQQILTDDIEASFFLTTRPTAAGDAMLDGSAPRVKVRSEPLVLESAPLDELLARSEVLRGPALRSKDPDPAAPTDGDVPVFVPEDVWETGHELARRGNELESAGVWTGRLMRDTNSPEVFLLIDECLLADHAAEEKYSVEFSGDTWGDVRSRLEQRRRRLNRPHERIIGSVHGHNFGPEPDAHGRMTCDSCQLLPVCSRTTAVASEDDFRWHQMVFAGQPWEILVVYGWNAREDEEVRCYGLRDAQLLPRTVRIVKS